MTSAGSSEVSEVIGLPRRLAQRAWMWTTPAWMARVPVELRGPDEDDLVRAEAEPVRDRLQPGAVSALRLVRDVIAAQVQGRFGKAGRSKGRLGVHRVVGQQNPGHIAVIEPPQQLGDPLVGVPRPAQDCLVVDRDRAHRVLLVHRRAPLLAVIMN
ncbi:hypothetical protein [Streptomyces sp. NPDC051219]|uniref:hypothetical protein n=1 Tax=Streptomyces sp. NPDC051219 TaxID=3155283 RepID=UPI003413AD98